MRPRINRIIIITSMTYEVKKFDLPTLNGISPATMKNHLELYAGYVKRANEDEDHFAFNFDGMRNHELFFEQFEGGANEMDTTSDLYKALCDQFGDEDFVEEFKECAMHPGDGWAMLFYDEKNYDLIIQRVESQQDCILIDCCPILVLDMWEHAYLMDYDSSEKEKYVDAFFENLNWEVVEKRYEEEKGES